eukprot:SAG31_NODE_1598_length_7798_cov_7.682167_6_plen_76_part_00
METVRDFLFSHISRPRADVRILDFRIRYNHPFALYAGNTPAKIAGLEGHPNLECLLQQHINAFTKCDAAPCHTFT